MELLIVVALAGLAMGYARFVRVPISTAFLQSFALVVITLYLAGLVGILRGAAGAVILLGGVLLLVEIAIRLRRGSREEAPIVAAVFLLLALLFWLLHGQAQYFFYDEYAHWGVFLKEMLANNGFWDARTNAMHPRYLPGPTLFQYLFSAFVGPADSIAYLAQFCLLIAPLLVLWENLGWKQVGWLAGILAMCLAILANFGHGIASLYVDHVLGAWFGGILLCYLRRPETQPLRLAPYAACLGVLALIKDSGLYFALAGAGIIALMVLQQRISRGEGAGRAAASSSATVLMLAVVALGLSHAWTWNRDAIGADDDLMSSVGIARGLLGQETGVAPDVREEISRRFSDVFFNQQVSKDQVSWKFNEFSYVIKDLFQDPFRLTTFSLLAICAAWFAFVILWWIAPPRRWPWLLMLGGSLAAAGGYLLILHAAYMFAFGDDGLRIPSYMRYAHTALLPLVMLAFAPLLPAFAEDVRERELRIGSDSIRVNALVFFAFLVGLYVLERPYLTPLLKSNPRVQFRAEAEAWFHDIRPVVGRDRVWVFLPVDKPNGFLGRVMSFVMSPTPAAIERSDAFIYRPDDELLASWSEYDYLWFPFAGDDLDATLERLSEGPLSSRLLRVENDDGTIRLVPVPVGAAADARN